MAIQENSLFKAASLLVLLFFSLVSAQSAREVDRIVVDGVEKPVFYEDKSGTPQKYFLGGNGNRVELAGHQRRKAQEKKEKFGVFGKKLYDTLSIMKAEEEVDVNITFALRPLPEPLKNKKLRKEEAVSQLQASFLDGVETLERRFGRLPSEVVDFKGKNGLRLRLRKSELLKLKTNPRIQSIELPANPRHEKILRQAPLEESFMGAGWNSGGLHFPEDCGEEFACGSGILVGVLERNPIWNSDSADHLDGSWFEKRPGTPIAPRHPHGLWTSSIIRNSGPGLGGSAFNGGGAYNANLSLSYPVAPESTMQDAYDWLLNKFPRIISHSWRFPRYLGGAHEAEANEFERQMDMATAVYPYVLNVLAAGNSGDTADGGENDACVDSSAVYNPPGWTAEQCQTVAWWSHNGLIVGAVDDDSTRSAFSAFRNGPEDNEAPHVMVRGSGIQLPWMAPFDSSATCPTDTAVANASGPLCGTSMAAPTVAALAAHIAGIGGASLYPELVKGILMASATSRPIRRSAWKRYTYDFYPFLDREIGAGIPHQPTADSIAKNEKVGSAFSSGVYGFKTFLVPSNATSYEEIDTITITHPQGGRIHFYMTWVGNPSNVTPGTRYAPDDMDLHVETENTWDYFSNSYQNTTEEVIHPILPDSATTFYVKKRLYYRALDENTPIWGSLVWTYAPPPVVEIHSPLDSSYTNQNEVPVEWSIDGRPDSSGSYSNPLSEGPNVIERCYDTYYFCDWVTVFLDQTAPVVAITAPSQDTAVGTEPILVQFTVDGIPRSRSVPLNPGLNLVVVDTLDAAGNRGADTLEITYAIPAGVPIWPSWSHLSVSDVWPSSLKIAWTPAVDDSGVSRYRIYRDDILIDSVPASVTQYSDAGLNMDQVYVYKVEAGDLRGNWTTDGPDSAFSTSDVLPPNPEEIAPPLDKTVASTIFSGVSFLFNDTMPIQTGMAPDAIDTVRAAVLRGVVKDRGGDPLPGVSVSVLGDKAFGSTVTREDGEYDLMVNGGGYVTLRMAKSGYLPVHRQLDIPWQRYVNYPEVILSQLDSISQIVSLDSGEPMQVFRASIVTDSDGSRQATLLIPTNTMGQRLYPDGTVMPLETITLRATEYTVGQNGPKAMPADLPATSAYTYAVEFSADDAVDEGSSVQFSQPIYSYLENFIGLPVGWQVPSAYYDRKMGQWIPEADGRVVKIHAITGGKAELEIDSSGNPADSTALSALGISGTELEKLALLYSVGASLWRVPVAHFSTYDFNLGITTKPKGKKPNQKNKDKETDEEDEECGSVIGCQSQVLGEAFPITGTPYMLHYRSDRVKDRLSAYTLEIPLTDTVLPDGIEAVQLEITIAGRYWVYHLEPETNLTFTFTWDGLDAYGREVQGRQPLSYMVGYAYEGYYLQPPNVTASFGLTRPLPGPFPVVARSLNYVKSKYSTVLGTWNNIRQHLGGWSVNVHHAYDISGKALYQGDGARRSATDLRGNGVLNTIAGTGEVGFSGDQGPASGAKLDDPYTVDVGPDGSIYICDFDNYRIRKVNPDGIITTVAGNGSAGSSGDGGLATEAEITPGAIDIGPDGSLYIVESTAYRVRKVNPDGIITTLAGTGTSGFSGDGGPATAAEFDLPYGVVASPDGSVYIADLASNRVRKVGPDGNIHTVVGNGDQYFTQDSIPALEASCVPHNIDLGPDGSLYIADQLNAMLFKMSPDGFFTRVAGTGSFEATGDGGLASNAGIQPYDVKVAKEGDDWSIYVLDLTFGRTAVRKIDPQGRIRTVVGRAGEDFGARDNGFATMEAFDFITGIALDSKGYLYFADVGNNKIRSVKTIMPDFGNEAFILPSQSGTQVYSFDAHGKHLNTRHGLTGGTLLSFEYDASGLLIRIRDGSGNETEFVRDLRGDLERIVSPYGQETELELNDSGFITKLINPAGEERRFDYTPSGLMTEYITPRGDAYIFTYDSLGRLKRDDDPAGGYKELEVEETETGVLSTIVTAMGRVKTYLVEKLVTGETRMVNTDPAGLSVETLLHANGLVSRGAPDSTITISRLAPGPQFGMQAPFPDSTAIVLPSGLKSMTTRKIKGIFSDPDDPLTLQMLYDTLIVNGQMFTSIYDSSTHTYSLFSPEGRFSVRKIDSLGRIVAAHSGGLDTIYFSYDYRGRLTSMSQGTGPNERILTYEYNIEGNLKKLIDAEQRVFEYKYDQAGKRTRVLLPDSQEILLAYDSSGNLFSITPPGKEAHLFEYTEVGKESEYLPPPLGAGYWSTSKEYNFDRQLLRITYPDSLEVESEYDSFGRLTGMQTPHGENSIAYHPITGKVESILSFDSILIASTYDGKLLKTEKWSGAIGGEVSFDYDGDFRLDSISVNDTGYSFQYDGDGFLVQASGLGLARDSENGLIRRIFINQIEDTLNYNGFGELIDYSTLIADSLHFSEEVYRDKLGRIIERRETLEGSATLFEYEYDSMGRLFEVKVDSQLFSRYNYDENGNRLSRILSSDTLDGIYDDQDRLLQYESLYYGYSDNGNLNRIVQSGDTTLLEYDLLGNLRSVHLSGGTHVEYLTDGRNRRVGKKVNGSMVQGFLYQNQLKPIAELDGFGNIVSRFVYASKSTVPDLVIKQGVVYRLISDHLGSPRLVVNVETGAIVQRMNYDEFGNVVYNSNPGFQPFGFAGGIYDGQTSLVRFGARDYFPWVGRWTSKDPIRFRGGSPNLYTYVGNDPLNRIDPMGLYDYETADDYASEFLDNLGNMGLPDVLDVGRNATIASKAARDMYPGDGEHNGNQDAMRHCVWSCLMSQSIGSENAEVAGNTHENIGDGNGQPCQERKMDQHNNKVGRNAGLQNNGRSCQQMCMDEFDSGGLMVID